MSDLPNTSDTNGENSDARNGPAPNKSPAPPRWFMIFGTIIIILMLLFILFHLTGGGMRGHLA